MVQVKQLFGTIARSTSAPAGYDQIDDTSEGRLKVHAEEAFKAGIKFKARFIGSLEIPKVRDNSTTKGFGICFSGFLLIFIFIEHTDMKNSLEL